MRFLLPLLALLPAIGGWAQSDAATKGRTETATFDFLSSYYQQDGNNAAVTGGIGTEALQDVANMFIINVPVDSAWALSLTLGADFYTSASTDNIDNHRSSASSQDVRTFGIVGYTYQTKGNGQTYGVKAGISSEYDYFSVHGGLSWTKAWNNGNTTLGVDAQAFFDNWSLIYPAEIRSVVKGTLPTSQRRSYNGQLTYTQVLNRRMQVALTAEAVYMEGLLSTPFHRVYLVGQALPDIERLPASRLKIPLGVRFNYFPFDGLVLRTYYRHYTDDFGIRAHTFSIETPIQVSRALTVSPFYRYHTQTAADYFAPYAAHTSAEDFYTSDYDLAALDSHKVGVGIGYVPLYGIGRIQVPYTRQLVVFDKLQFRSAYYQRSTGLHSALFSIDLGFKLRRVGG